MKIVICTQNAPKDDIQLSVNYEPSSSKCLIRFIGFVGTFFLFKTKSKENQNSKKF